MTATYKGGRVDGLGLFQGSGDRVLALAANFSRLRRLELTEVMASPESIRGLLCLEELDISGGRYAPQAGFIDALVAMPALRKATLRGMKLSDDAVGRLHRERPDVEWALVAETQAAPATLVVGPGGPER